MIALLTLLNAIPFSYGYLYQPNTGFLWAVAGWLLLSWPLLTSTFIGPSDDSRKLGLFDTVKLAVSAAFLFFAVAIPEDTSMARIIFLLASFIILFIPIGPDSPFSRDQRSALYHLGNIGDLGYKDDPEYAEMKKDIENNQK